MDVLQKVAASVNSVVFLRLHVSRTLLCEPWKKATHDM
jgi:hypothetical protein